MSSALRAVGYVAICKICFGGSSDPGKRLLAWLAMATTTDRLTQVLESSQVQLLADWIKALRATRKTRASATIGDPELQAQCQEFIALLSAAATWRTSRPSRGGRSRTSSPGCRARAAARGSRRARPPRS